MDDDARELRRQRDEALQVQKLQHQMLQKIRAMADEALGVAAVPAPPAAALSSVVALQQSYGIVANGVVPALEKLEMEMRASADHPTPAQVRGWADRVAVLRRWPRSGPKVNRKGSDGMSSTLVSLVLMTLLLARLCPPLIVPSLVASRASSGWRLDVWMLTGRMLRSVGAVLPGCTVKIVPIEFPMCTEAWELSIEVDGVSYELVAYGVFTGKIVKHVGGDPSIHSAMGVGNGFERLAMLAMATTASERLTPRVA
jgi:hypothetical protein